MCWGERALVCAVFLICLTGAILLPVKQCPDETGRRLLSTWIFRTGTLPTGDEMETIIDLWGFSYALRPFLSSMISALCMRIVSVVTLDPRALLPASRLVSVCSITACAAFCLRLGRCLFQYRSSACLLATFVCFLPQTLFLGMYQNCDALALASTSAMLYYLASGAGTGWPWKTCIGLGISLSIGLLSYYTVYPWLLLGYLYFAYDLARNHNSKGLRSVIARLTLITGVCCLLAGWFFMRNAWLHEGDFLGIAWESRSRANMMQMGYTLYNPICPKDEGLSFLEFFFEGECYWIRMTLMSLVGVFGYMDILMPFWLYNVYFALMLAIFPFYLWARKRRHIPTWQRGITRVMLLAVVLSFALHAWQSYARDFEPQGRYVIEATLLLGYLFAFSVDALLASLHDKSRAHTTMTESLSESHHSIQPAIVLSIAWIALALCSVPTWLRILS